MRRKDNSHGVTIDIMFEQEIRQLNDELAPSLPSVLEKATAILGREVDYLSLNGICPLMEYLAVKDVPMLRFGIGSSPVLKITLPHGLKLCIMIICPGKMLWKELASAMQCFFTMRISWLLQRRI